MLNHSLVPVGSTGYDIDNSLRFNDNDSAKLSRTPSVAGNRKTWTWSGWVKRGNLVAQAQTANYAVVFGTPYQGGGYDNCHFWFGTGDVFVFYDIHVNVNMALATTSVFRDASAWYHIVVAVDTTQATSSDRVKLYVNGELDTTFGGTYPALNYDTQVNRSGLIHDLGGTTINGTPSRYYDGLLAEVNFVDGQALTPSDFGETDETYGHWKAKKYTGTYGTNGFYLDFKNSGSLGNDVSGAGNNWTPNNLAATDQMLDSPTNNFCTWNPTMGGVSAPIFTQGNLRESGNSSGSWDGTWGTMGFSSGKWYWEDYMELSTHANKYVGVFSLNQNYNINEPHTATGGHISYSAESGNKAVNDNYPHTSYGASYTTGDIIGIAVDLDGGTPTITFYKNNVSQGAINLPVNMTDGSTLTPFTSKFYTNDYLVANFGQDSSFAGNKTAQGNADDNGIGDFYYTPPTGFLALCTQNLPEPTVVPSEHFNTVNYFGNGYPATGTQSITGVGFQPDLVWTKERSTTGYHHLLDSVRGSTNALFSNGTNAEYSQPTCITSFDADGFSLGADTNGDGVNRLYTTYSAAGNIAWNWKANGAGVSNTDGSITSTVSANVDAGFSIVSYTGNATTNTTFTVGHGLTETPDLVIIKNRDWASNVKAWEVWHKDIGNNLLALDQTDAVSPGDYTYIMGASPTATTFSIRQDTAVSLANRYRANGVYDYIAYCFHSVEGYSKVGSYTGNGSTDGTFVHCGFRPAYVLIKCYTASGEEWEMYDNERLGYNPNNYRLNAHSSASEGAYANRVDIVSNGFKLRTTANPINGSGKSYIFIAFAENPMKYSNAR